MFSAFFIDRPKFALVISLLIVIAGVIAIGVIPVSEYPDITPPQVKVSTLYRGANASVVEQSVAAPVEAEVNGVDDMLYMSSTSTNDGRYELAVTFRVGTDPDIAAINVQNRVAVTNAQLPQDVIREGITTRKQSTSMLLVVNLYSPEGRHDELFLSNYASIYLQDRLARINGVGSVSQFGARDYGMRIWLNPDRLTALDLTTADIVGAIESQNVQASAGQLGAPPYATVPQFQYTLQAKGRLTTVEEFEDIIVRAEADGAVVRLRDVARIELGSQSYSAVSKLNNRPAANIAVFQSPGANALEVADAVHAALDDMARRFPPDVAYTVLYDTTNAVRASVREVIETLLVTFVLVVGITFAFLGDWRSTLVPACAIPVSLVGALAVVYALGYSANMITLFALILAIGVVVDDSIVVVENVQRTMRDEGLPPREAARRAMREVTGPIIATTLVLLAVFVPVAFMPGITGELYRQFSITIGVAVVISSLVALTLAPALCALVLRPAAGEPRGPLRLFARLVAASGAGYLRMTGWLVRRLGTTMAILALLAVVTGYLFVSVPRGFIPTEDKGLFFVNVQLPDGASLARTQAVTDDIVRTLLEAPGVTDAISVAGYSLLSGSASNAALVIPILSHWDQRETFELGWVNILDDLNRQLAAIPAAEVFAFPLPPIRGLGQAGGIEAQVQDYEGRSPQALAAAVRSLVFRANQDPALRNVFSTYSANVPQLFLDVDRAKAETLGLSVASIFATLQANLGARFVNDFNLYGKVYRVMLQAEAGHRDRVEDIGRIHVRNAAGDMVPLRALVDVEPALGPLAIGRYNQLKSARVQGSPADGRSTGEAIAALDRVAATALPSGYGIEWTGTSRQELEAGGLIAFVFTLALLFAYLFLVAQYESWSIPLAVICSVVVAVLGALVPLALLPALDYNLYAQIATVLLIGLAAKTSILMIEFSKTRREAGLGIREAALEGARRRFRAVMMTALSFIFGVLPLVFATGAGAASRTSVGYVVVCGMAAATAVGIFFIPPLYVAFQSLRERLKGAPPGAAVREERG